MKFINEFKEFAVKGDVVDMGVGIVIGAAFTSIVNSLVKDIFNMIKRINEQGVTVLLVEQNIRQTLEMSDRACVLENGRIVIQGTGKELISNDHVKEAYLGI